MIFKGYGIVWDAEKDKPLCEFKGGQFETKSKRIINKLTELGFDNDGNAADEVDDPSSTTEGQTSVQ